MWCSLLVLLTLTTASAYLHLGAWNTVSDMSIAAAKVALIGLFFMHLRDADETVRFASLAAGLFLFLMAFLSFADFLTRSAPGAPWIQPVQPATGPYG